MSTVGKTNSKKKEKTLADSWYNKSHVTQLNSVMGPLRKGGMRYGTPFSNSPFSGFFQLN